MSRPRLIVFAGLPGVGKSAIAEKVARRLGAVWLRVDTVEAAILQAGVSPSFETGLAAYLVARDVAEPHLRAGGAAVVDAVNGVEPARAMWRELAQRCSADLRVIEVRCSDRDEHRRRVEARSSATPPLRMPTWEEVLHREYLPWTEPVLVLDGVRSPEANARTVLRWLASASRTRGAGRPVARARGDAGARVSDGGRSLRNSARRRV
jgi:predicted kinase